MRRLSRGLLLASAAALAACASLAVERREPVLFAPGTISDARWQWRLTFTPDGETAYYAVSDEFFPATRRATIVVSRRRGDGAWTSPAPAPFSGTHSDMDPFITPDGRRLYFSSDRPIAGERKDDFDLWYVDRTAGGWGEPVHAGPGVNSEADELYASATSDGTLYFASGPFAPDPALGWDIYSAEPEGASFRAREPVRAVNTRVPFDPQDPTADWEFNPEVSPDGQALLFTSLRPGGHGAGDLYVTCRRGGGWSTPRNLGPPINTTDDEFHPTLGPGGRTLYFARTILGSEVTPGDFYTVPLVPCLR